MQGGSAAGPALWVHIGLPKTGSSAVQAAFKASRSELRGAGVDYPDTGEFGGGHVRLAWPLLSRERKQQRDVLENINTGGLHDLWRALARETSERDCTKVFVSTEYFSEVDPAALADCARAVSPDIRILVYLRRQDELIESGYKQSVKAGLTGRRFSFHGYTRMYDYSVLLAGWSQAFGRERIVAKVYDEGLARRGVVADVVETLGIRVGVVPEIEERSNPSMHPALVELQRLANALGETQSDAVSLVRERIGSLESGAVRSFLSTDERQAILAAYAESNAEVARTYFGRPDGHLFDDPQERLDGAGRDAPIEVLAALGVLLASELSRVQEQVNGLLRRLDSDPR